MTGKLSAPLVKATFATAIWAGRVQVGNKTFVRPIRSPRRRGRAERRAVQAQELLQSSDWPRVHI